VIDRIAEFQERFAATTVREPNVANTLAIARGVVARCAPPGQGSLQDACRIRRRVPA